VEEAMQAQRAGWAFGTFIGSIDWLTIPGSAYRRPELYVTWEEADRALNVSGLRGNPYQDYTVAYVTETPHSGCSGGYAFRITDAPGARLTVLEVFRTGDHQPYAALCVSPAGGRFTAHLDRGQVSWADHEVWAHPQRHGLGRWHCPGHGGAVCQYGACDEIRITDAEGFRLLVAASVRQESGAPVAP
jgi:hypothetical protein